MERLQAPGVSDQTLPCGHVMHESCDTEMRRRGASARCPLCRAAYPEELMTVQDMVDKAVDHFLGGSFEEAHRRA